MSRTDITKVSLDREFITYIFSRIQVSTINFYKGVPCWEWTGNINIKNKYGRINYKGRYFQAHRAIYYLFIEPIPPELHCDHLCRNHSCVNPVHIEPVTPVENVMRGNWGGAINARKTHCKHGHALSGDNLIQVNERYRQCRICTNRRVKQHIEKVKNNPSITPRAVKVHCKYGHEFTPDNVYFKQGMTGRSCRTCNKMRSDKFRQKRKQLREGKL